MIRFAIWIILVADFLLLGGCFGVHHAFIAPPVLGPPTPAATVDVQTLWLLRTNTLVACLCVLATPVCVGLAIWLRSAMFATFAVSSVGMLIATMATKWVLVHTEAMLWCVAVLLLGVGAGVLWHLWRNRVGFFGAVRVAEALKPEREMEQAKAARKAVQIVAAGSASAIIDQARERLGYLERAPTNDPGNIR